MAHVEAGLRSGDMSMPEGDQPPVTDAISDWFFVTEPSAAQHLLREGKDASRGVHDVGHVMADNVLFQAHKLEGHGHVELRDRCLQSNATRATAC